MQERIRSHSVVRWVSVLLLCAILSITYTMWQSGTTKAAASDQTISIGDASIVEGDTSTRTLYFTVALSRPATAAVSVKYNLTGYWVATSGSCGVSGVDFNSKSGKTQTINFPLLSSGVTSTYKQISAQVCSDTTVEPTETFIATLANPTGGYKLLKHIGTGTIVDDDAVPSSLPRLSVGDATVSEGNAGNRAVKFTLSLSRPATSTVTASYKILSGTGAMAANCGSLSATGTECANYGGQTKTVSFAAGAVQKNISVTILPDNAREYDEVYKVELINAVGASVYKANAIGTISNDDDACGSSQAAPAQYDSVVVVALENRTWAYVGGVGFGGMPYLFQLAQSCSHFSSWSQPDVNQSSMTQYGAQVTGNLQPQLINNCRPSATCSTSADNIFRQARVAGKTAINYVEGATTGCSAALSHSDLQMSWVEWVPAMYMWGGDDQSYCNSQVRPLTELDPNNLPNFAFISPNACNGGHEVFTCGPDPTVDNWARANIEPIIQSTAYKNGKVAIFVWYDEYDPVPNMQIAPTATAGPLGTAGVGYSSTLKAWESMLGLPCLGSACTAVDMRAPAGL